MATSHPEVARFCDRGAAAPEAVLLPQPCWRIDRDDDWETPHHATREAVETDHADVVRSDYGWPLSIAGAFAIVPGAARRETRRCREWTCPDCGCVTHTQGRDASCADECGFERIRAGLERYARPMTFEATGNTFVRPGSGYARAWPVDGPTATLTASHTRALVVPVEGRDGKKAAPAMEPLRTQTARHETALLVPTGGTWNESAYPAGSPFRTRATREAEGVAFIAELRGGGSDARHVREPLATVCASGNHHMLVRHNTARGNPGQMCTPAAEPARTLTTAGHQSLVGWPHELPAVEDCTFRMLAVPEVQAAMAFTPDYVVTGSKREQVRQLGNGVTPPAAEWLVRASVASLERTGSRARSAA